MDALKAYVIEQLRAAREELSDAVNLMNSLLPRLVVLT